MKMIGLIGGMSWESTSLYYRIINSEINAAMGGLHSAKLVLYSVDFEEIVELQRVQAWDEAGGKLVAAGQALKNAGAEALVICTNTMHIVAAQVEEAVGLPVIHIADCTGEEIKRQGMSRVGLIGTQFTMEQPFYRKRMEARFGIRVVTPGDEDRALVHNVIFNELCKGIVTPESKLAYQQVIKRLKDKGAQAVILGCTEICMLLEEQECEGIRLFNTTLIHAQYAAKFALQNVRARALESV